MLSLEAVKIERNKLKEELIAMKALHQAEASKVRKFENKVLNMRMLLMISWALFVGFIAASILK